MEKKFLRSHLLKLLNIRGQVMVLFALLTPLLILFVGVGMDLGWYYLNVSRLQNAADAAVVAGAQTLAEDHANFANYSYNGVLTDKFPSHSPDKTPRTAGDAVAKKYVADNLGEIKTVKKSDDPNEKNTVEIIADSWSSKTDSAVAQQHYAVTMTPGLYKSGNHLYYVVKLSEKIQHFFMPGWFDDMDAPVVAVAKLDYIPPIPPQGEDADYDVEGTDICRETYKLADITVIKNWEWQDYYSKSKIEVVVKVKDENGKDVTVKTGAVINPSEDYTELTGGKEIYGNDGKKWNEFQDKRNGKKTPKYETGKHYRTEIVKVKPKQTSEDDHYDGTGQGTNFDSLNLDFHPDLNYKFTEDWDISIDPAKETVGPDGKTLKSIQYVGRGNDVGYQYRIHATFNFDDPYPVRANHIDKETNPEDVLFVRIESEPIKLLPFTKYNGDGTTAAEHKVFSTVRQIILNINKSNMDPSTRPLMFYYTGPEKLNQEYDSEDFEHLTADKPPEVRDSQPLILNLNADARVILFAPYSPVVIKGNGHKFQGYVIAKKFVQLTDATDYDSVQDAEGVIHYYKKGISETERALEKNEYFFVEEEGTFIDRHGNVQTKKLDLDNVTRNTNSYEQHDPTEEEIIEDAAYEKVYKMNTVFGIDTSDDSKTTSYYSSFNLTSLKRNVYTYLDNYKDGTHDNSVDMFFTTKRALWID